MTGADDDRPQVVLGAERVEKRFPPHLRARLEIERAVYAWLAAAGYPHAPARLPDTDADTLMLARVGARSLTAALDRDDEATRARRLAVLGRAIAAFHDLDAATCAIGGPRSADELYADWRATAAKVALAPQTDAAVRRTIDDAAGRGVATRLCLVHRDLRFDNVVVGDDPDELWLVDWEMSSRSVAAHDLARFVWLELGDEVAAITAFRQGYAADGRALPEPIATPSADTAFFRMLFALEVLAYFAERRALSPDDRAFRDQLAAHLRSLG